MKCRGCGGDTNEIQASFGWMHFECEIERLSGLYDEAQSIADSIDEENERLTVINAELLAACKIAKPEVWPQSDAYKALNAAIAKAQEVTK